ncbi:hypothetical protein GPALN_005355 [Globodera pallida]|nr:hypothetical protein GPALN_005355 [Globodera pallida]
MSSQNVGHYSDKRSPNFNFATPSTNRPADVLGVSVEVALQFFSHGHSICGAGWVKKHFHSSVVHFRCLYQPIAFGPLVPPNGTRFSSVSSQSALFPAVIMPFRPLKGMPIAHQPQHLLSFTNNFLLFPVLLQFPAFLYTLLLLSVLCFDAPKLLQGLAPSPQERQRQLRVGVEIDPNVQFQCRGALGEFAACLCNDQSLEVACINAQFVDNAVFQYVNGHYNSAVQLTFHGNNFQDLPEGPLFGSHTLDRLRVLNISANYIVNLHRNALRGAPNIEVLDLSNNEIVLGEENIHFLSHTPRLRKLFLRRAFTSPHNRNAQFALMLKLFEKADLRRLELLDLSYNFFSNVPSQLPCPFPSPSPFGLTAELAGVFVLELDLPGTHWHY